jgi:glycine betaine/proline transport system substrate-binding protein
LAEKDETVYQFLQNFNYGSSDPQIAMLALLDEGMSVEEAAEQWIEENETVWQAWLP